MPDTVHFGGKADVAFQNRIGYTVVRGQTVANRREPMKGTTDGKERDRHVYISVPGSGH